MLSKINISPYHVDLWIVISKDPHKEVTQLNVSNPGINIQWSDSMSAYTRGDIYNGNAIVVVFDEVIHIKNMVYSHSDITHDPLNDEPEAYLSGWIAGKIWEMYREFKKR
jgi:hypothetical protein